MADCTGHGVPGAMMSAIGINLLDRITGYHQIKKPEIILQILQFELKKLLKKSETGINDGMDIGLIAINMINKTLVFSGAHHDLLLIKKDNPAKVEVIKGDKLGIGGVYSEKLQNFKFHRFNIQDIDKLFMLTDGVKDQFGIDESLYANVKSDLSQERKFTQKRLIRIIENQLNTDLETIGKSIDENIVAWQGKRKQTDDMLMIGFEINHGVLS